MYRIANLLRFGACHCITRVVYRPPVSMWDMGHGGNRFPPFGPIRGRHTWGRKKRCEAPPACLDQIRIRYRLTDANSAGFPLKCLRICIEILAIWLGCIIESRCRRASVVRSSIWGPVRWGRGSNWEHGFPFGWIRIPRFSSNCLRIDPWYLFFFCMSIHARVRSLFHNQYLDFESKYNN